MAFRVPRAINNRRHNSQRACSQASVIIGIACLSPKIDTITKERDGLQRNCIVCWQSFNDCSKRSDSGERCEVQKAMKSRGGLEREVPSLTLSFIFSRSFLLRTAPHYLNARNWLFVHALWCFKILNTRVWLCTSLRAVHLSCHSKPALSLNFPN